MAAFHRSTASSDVPAAPPVMRTPNPNHSATSVSPFLRVGKTPQPATRTPDAYARMRPVLLAGPGLAIVAVFMLWPLIWFVGMSFTSWNGYGRITWAGLNTWTSLLSDPTFQAALTNTLKWIVLTATVPVILGFGLAIVFDRAGRIFGPAGRAVAVIPLLLPPAVAAVTWSIVYNPDYGPLNGILGWLRLPQPDWLGDSHVALWALFAIELWSCVGFSVLVFTAAIRSIDRAYFDLARVEGAGPWHELRLILIPACRKSAALAVVVTVVIASQVFGLLLVITNVGNGTNMVPLDMYNRAFGGGNVSQGVAEAALQVGMGVVLAALAFVISGNHPGMSGEGEYHEPKPSLPATALAFLAGAVMLLPLLWDVLAAFTSGVNAVLRPLTVTWPLNFSSFVTAWNQGIGSGLWQSAVIGGAVVALTLGLALPAAFVLSGRTVNRVVRALILAILVIALLQPGEAYLIPLYYLLLQLHLGDTLVGLVLAEASRELPFAILLLWIFIRALPSDIIGAAELETQRGFNMLIRIVAPMTAPIAVAVGLWVFVTSWSEATLPNILLSNSAVITAPVALKTFAGNHDTEFNLLAAGTLLLVLPVVFLLLLAFGPASRGLRAAGKVLAT
jgi:ABC-type sugar transport system permease subunit